VEKLVSDAPDMSVPAACDVMIAKVENLSVGEDFRTVLLVGTVGETRLDSFANKLTKRAESTGSALTFEASSDLDKNAAAVRRLRTADACIVVEEVGGTVYRDAAELVELVMASGKPLLGTVYL
jgi:nucleoside-triphosphatase THEP1